MFEDLSNKEKQILNLFELEEIEDYYHLKHDLYILDPNQIILSALVYKGYINGTVTRDELGNCHVEYDYSINKRKLSNRALVAYGLRKPEDVGLA